MSHWLNIEQFWIFLVCCQLHRVGQLSALGGMLLYNYCSVLEVS